MSTKAFRSAVFGAIDEFMQASHPGIFVMYENGPQVDEEAVGDIFVDVSLRFYGARMVEVGLGGRSRHSGAVSVTVYSRQADGTEVPDDLLENLIELLARQRYGVGFTTAAQRTVPDVVKGWYRTGVLIPFMVTTR